MDDFISSGDVDREIVLYYSTRIYDSNFVDFLMVSKSWNEED